MKRKAVLCVVLLVTVAATAGDDLGQRYVEVHDEPDVYTAKLPGFDAGQHSDGSAAVDLEGVAVEVVGGTERPVREPVWCLNRFGPTRTPLPDGRLVCIGGEHEDHYDPDFCIYNDVIVVHPDAKVGSHTTRRAQQRSLTQGVGAT